MKKNKITLITATILITFTPIAPAQTVEPENTFEYNLIRDITENIIWPATNFRSNSEKIILHQVHIIITNDSLFLGPHAGFNSSHTRVVVLPRLYILLLIAHIESIIIEEADNNPNFSQRWLHQALWRSPGIYRGPPPQQPLDYAGKTPTEKEAFVRTHGMTLKSLVNAALIDVLLHELGHHAIDRWYFPQTTETTNAIDIERQADCWATHAFEAVYDHYPNFGLRDRSNSVGRLFALENIFGIQRFLSTARVYFGETHPDTPSRISNILDANCSSLTTDPNNLCNIEKERVSHMISTINQENDYRIRAESGEVFATFQLALIKFSNNEQREACRLFEKSADPNQIFDTRLWHYIGYCYEKGYLGDNLSPADLKSKAIIFYKKSGGGWVDTEAAFIRLGVESPTNHPY